MEGKELIIQKIISDAETRAKSTREEGNNKAQEIIEEANQNAKLYKDNYMKDSALEREEIIRRRITVANLEVKKINLSAKKEVILKAFDATIKEVKKDVKQYKELLTSLLKEAQDGDTIQIAEADKDIIDNKWVIDTAKEKYNIKITVAKDFGQFSGGFMIIGKSSDKNVTLDLIIEELKEKYESKIADMLFKDGE
ncbi:MAG: hypothetical protein K5765_01575 [Clostridia bacterium]|nr:hypothetical protein [Clostridia bacterium]